MKLAWLIIPTLALTAAACGGSDKADTVDNPPPATATPTTAPTNSGPAATPTDSPIDPGVLAKAVLELSDMPSGFAVSAPGDSSDDDDFCGIAASIKEPKNRVDATFEMSTFGPFIIQRIDLQNSRGDAGSVLDGIRDSFKKCGATWTDTATPPTTWNISALNFPKVGDDTFAVRISTNNVAFFGTAQVDYVYFRRGPAVSGVAYVAVGPAAAGVSPLEDVVKKADAKIAKAGIR